MIQVSENLWLEVNPTGKVLLGNDHHVVRIDIHERDQVIDFIQSADDYLDIQVAGSEDHREEMMLREREIS